MSDELEGGEGQVEQGALEGADEQSSKVEAEAKLFGWNPDYEGPGKRTAEEFLEEGKRINGFLRKDLEKLRSEISKRDMTIGELQQTMQEFAAFHQETEKKAYERAVKELKEERKAALREGDGEKVVEIEDRIEQLEEAAPQQRTPGKAAPSPTADPVWQSWVAENKWFTESPKLRAVSNGYGDLVRAEFPNLVGREFLEEVKRRVAEDFPESFSNSERRRPSPVGGSGEQRGNGGGKSYASLPAEAKIACDKFVKQGLVASREQYVKEYFGE